MGSTIPYWFDVSVIGEDERATRRDGQVPMPLTGSLQRRRKSTYIFTSTLQGGLRESGAGLGRAVAFPRL